MKKPPRKERRANERELQKLVRQRERLTELSPGGSADHPLEVDGAALVEVTAKATRCGQCGSELRLLEHEALPHRGDVLRVTSLRCVMCGAPRRIFFRIKLLQ